MPTIRSAWIALLFVALAVGSDIQHSKSRHNKVQSPYEFSGPPLAGGAKPEGKFPCSDSHRPLFEEIQSGIYANYEFQDCQEENKCIQVDLPQFDPTELKKLPPLPHGTIGDMKKDEEQIRKQIAAVHLQLRVEFIKDYDEVTKRDYCFVAMRANDDIFSWSLWGDFEDKRVALEHSFPEAEDYIVPETEEYIDNGADTSAYKLRQILLSDYKDYFNNFTNPESWNKLKNPVLRGEVTFVERTERAHSRSLSHSQSQSKRRAPDGVEPTAWDIDTSTPVKSPLGKGDGDSTPDVPGEHSMCYIHEDAANLLDQLLANPQYQQMIDQCHANNAKVVFTGHSMGAAVATLATLRYVLDNQEITSLGLVTFGSPRVGHRTFSVYFHEQMKDRPDATIKRYVPISENTLKALDPGASMDPITRMPPHSTGWRHVGDPVFTTCSVTNEKFNNVDPACHSMEMVYKMDQVNACDWNVYLKGPLYEGPDTA